jgi:pimeloyl-[acyl-carrier protein] methyl ester esterase
MILKPFVSITGNPESPALALLHGWGLHGGIWQTLLPELEKHYRVYNIDLPGFGLSPVHNGDYNLDYLVDSVAQVLPEQCYLLGWSLGGLVATALTLEHPSRVTKLVTVASNPSFVASSAWPYGMKKSVLDSFINYLQDDFEGTLIKFLSIQTMGSPSQKDDIKTLKDTVFIHGQPAKKALRGGLEILNRVDLVPKLKELEQLNIPVLRIYGRLDSLVPVKVADDVSQLLPGSTSIVYRRAAHAPFLSLMTEFCDDLNQFLLGEDTDSRQQAKEVN